MRNVHAPGFVLEPQVASHAKEMFTVLSDPELYEFENGPPPSEALLLERFLKLESRASHDGTEQWLNWVIRLDSGELIGYVQATVTSRREAHIAYVLASRCWGRGIGSAATAAMMEELATHYGCEQFYATLKARNHRSLALLHRLKFSPIDAASNASWEVEPDEIVMGRSAETPCDSGGP